MVSAWPLLKQEASAKVVGWDIVTRGGVGEREGRLGGRALRKCPQSVGRGLSRVLGTCIYFLDQILKIKTLFVGFLCSTELHDKINYIHWLN